MAFQKGKPKTGGRKAGTTNKATIEIKQIARTLLEDPAYQRNLKRRIYAGKAPYIEQLLYHYAYGKPPQNVTVSGQLTLEELVLGSMEREEHDERTPHDGRGTRHRNPSRKDHTHGT